MKSPSCWSVAFASLAIGATASALSPIVAKASPIILDGTFQDLIGTGSNLTPWSDWTNAGVTRQTAPGGIPGNYASMPVGADLFQRFDAPAAGDYTLSFDVENASPWTAVLIVAIQVPLGPAPGQLGWFYPNWVLTLAPSTSFLQETLPVTLTPATGSVPGSLIELTFSNSYDYPDPTRGFQNSINPNGTIINVADVSLTPAPAATPLPASWTFMLIGLAGFGLMACGRQNKIADAPAV